MGREVRSLLDDINNHTSFLTDLFCSITLVLMLLPLLEVVSEKS